MISFGVNNSAKLAPRGVVVLLWNERKLDASPFLIAYESLLRDISDEYRHISRSEATTDSSMDQFFGPERWGSEDFPNRTVPGVVRLRLTRILGVLHAVDRCAVDQLPEPFSAPQGYHPVHPEEASVVLEDPPARVGCHQVGAEENRAQHQGIPVRPVHHQEADHRRQADDQAGPGSRRFHPRLHGRCEA